MAGDVLRRPLPAVISLVALLVLTGLVWWRVLNRDTSTEAKQPACPTPTATASPTSTLPPPSTIDVQVLNGTSRTGIAGDARSALQSAGFKSTRQAGNYSGKPRVSGVGQIRYPRSAAPQAALLRYYLPGTKLVPVTSTRQVLTVVLGPQYKRVTSKAAASSAIAAARASVSGAPSPSPTRAGC